jgi:hypothetical protein
VNFKERKVEGENEKQREGLVLLGGGQKQKKGIQMTLGSLILSSSSFFFF